MPAITTARPDFALMYGKMLDRIDAWQPEETGRTERWPIPYEFIRRESCGCMQGNAFLSTKKSGELKIDNLLYTRHIRAMGNFIRKTLSMNSLDKLSEQLSALFSGWPNPFYFAAVLDENDRNLARASCTAGMGCPSPASPSPGGNPRLRRGFDPERPRHPDPDGAAAAERGGDHGLSGLRSADMESAGAGAL